MEILSYAHSLLVILLCLLITDGRPRQIGNNANDLVDYLIDTYKPQIKQRNLDPLEVGNIGVEQCRECSVSGLSTIHRTGDSNMETINSFMIVDLSIGATEIITRCNCLARVLFVDIGGRIKVQLNNLEVYARINQSNTVSDLRSLQEFEITNQGSLEIGLEGSGFRKFFNEVLLFFFRGRITDTVRDAMNTYLPELFNKLVASGGVSFK